jgi:arylsulfatase
MAFEVAGYSEPRPNIILIMADDMGYSDVGCYGGEISTPNIDRLAADGLRFSQFYNCAVCGTTRASLMTGLYHHQVGVRTWNGARNNRCVNIGEALHTAGYRTMMVGKWTDSRSPNFKGFDRSFGSLARLGPTNYFKMNRTDEHFLDEEAYTLPAEGYFKTDAYTDYAVRFVHEAAALEQPFFLYVAYVAPHWPLHARESDIAKYRDVYRQLGWDECRARRLQQQRELGLVGQLQAAPRDSRVPPWNQARHQDWEAERMAVYAAQIACMDRNIGRILEALAETEQLQDSLIMFLSDNGATDRYPKPKSDGSFYLDRKNATWRTDGTRTIPVVPGVMPGPADTFGGYGPEWAHVSNTPVRGYKQSNYEGGILTPLIVRWPGVTQPSGQITRQVGHVIDIMPTCLEVARAEYPAAYQGREILPLEGKSLAPILHGKQREGHDALCWELGGHQAVRMKNWKLVGRPGSPWELYDLEADWSEMNDVAKRHPERVQKMSAAYNRWAQRVGIAAKR